MADKVFVFEDYQFNAKTKTLNLTYSYVEGPTFHESFRFDFDFVDYDEAVLERAVTQLFFMAGVSYYKLYVPGEIIIKKGLLDPAVAAFLSKTYQRGLGEFFYINNLSPHTPVVFPSNSPPLPVLETKPGAGQLVGIGGGKDSLVSVELLREQPEITTWSLNHRQQLTPLVNRIGLPHFWVDRTWDRQLLDLNSMPGTYNGHVPISAILACVGSIVATLSGKRDAIVSNEQSANEPSLVYDGVAINHQYSKSQEFEADYQALLLQNFGGSIRYYSLLRPLSELRITELFGTVMDTGGTAEISSYEKYHDVFSSCNRAFVHGSNHLFWDASCAKCAFIFLALTPFIDRTKLEKLFGKNLLLDPSLQETYLQLLGIEGDKPLDCVGEIKESRAAMRLSQTIYPELATYQFDLPPEYDYRTLNTHLIPPEVWQSIKSVIGTV